MVVQIDIALFVQKPENFNGKLVIAMCQNNLFFGNKIHICLIAKEFLDIMYNSVLLEDNGSSH